MYSLWDNQSSKKDRFGDALGWEDDRVEVF